MQQGKENSVDSMLQTAAAPNCICMLYVYTTDIIDAGAAWLSMDPEGFRSSCFAYCDHTSEHRPLEVSAGAVEKQHTVVWKVQSSRTDSASLRHSQPGICLTLCNSHSQMIILLSVHDILRRQIKKIRPR